MPKINFVFIPHHNSGAHFLIWSMYYLSGQQTHWTGKEIQSVHDPQDIMAGKNAHSHKVLMVRGLDQCKAVLEMSQNVDVPTVNVYVVQLSQFSVIKKTFGIDATSATPDQIHYAKKIAYNDTKKLIDYLQHYHKFSAVKYSDFDNLNLIYNDRSPCNLNEVEVDNIDDKINLFQQQFYKTTADFFDKEIWDRREYLALTLHTEPPPAFDHLVDYSIPNLIYSTDDVWNDLPNVMRELLDYYELPLVESRLASWKQAYAVWREKHDNHFSRCFDRIIDAIVNNHYMSLRRFNLNFHKEMLIQHALITRHNLNLKTWKLEKFPENTQQLHLLLEPNIHSL